MNAPPRTRRSYRSMVTIGGVKYEAASAKVARGIAGLWRVLLRPARRRDRKPLAAEVVEFFTEEAAARQLVRQLRAIPRGHRLIYRDGRRLELPASRERIKLRERRKQTEAAASAAAASNEGDTACPTQPPIPRSRSRSSPTTT